jgi:DNA-binding transcriptional ArsR family regulator
MCFYSFATDRYNRRMPMKDPIDSFSSTFGRGSRIRILEALAKSPLSVSQISRLTNIEQTNVSHNLKFLLKRGIVDQKIIGREHIYVVRKEIRPVIEGVLSNMVAHRELIEKGIVVSIALILFFKMNVYIDPMLLEHAAKSNILSLTSSVGL